MIAYTGFAEVYDAFMDNVPYDEWASYLLTLLKENGVREGLLCDLACGTGAMTMRLFDAGFPVIGIDYSVEMLNIALQKKEDRDILYLHQDMREIELVGKVAAFVCVCDGMNYLLNKEDLKKTFRKVHSYLDENGIFIFDMNTIYKYREILGDSTIAENREEMSFIWENYYDEEERINEYDLTLFVKNGKDDTYLRFEEVHYQKGYEIAEVKALLEEEGLSCIAVYGAFSKEEPKEEEERVYFIAKKMKG